MDEEILGKLIGKKFGKLTIINAYYKENSTQILVDCQCECGNKLEKYPFYLLVNGNTKSCGCSRTSKKVNPEMGAPKKDIFNEKFNKLTVLSEDENGTVTAKCDCGNIVEIPKFRTKMFQLRKTGMCKECRKKEREKNKKYTDFKKGDKFGYLTVIRRVEDGAGGIARYECQCHCGNKKIVAGKYLANGTTKSCGCMKKQNFRKRAILNGLTQTPVGRSLYAIWKYYINGFKNAPNQFFKEKYIDKGIKFFPEWTKKEDGFVDFYNWATLQENPYDMGNRRFLERIDETKDFTPDNCYFARKR